MTPRTENEERFMMDVGFFLYTFQIKTENTNPAGF